MTMTLRRAKCAGRRLGWLGIFGWLRPLGNLESCSKALSVPIGDVLEDAKVICLLLVLVQCSLFCVPEFGCITLDTDSFVCDDDTWSLGLKGSSGPLSSLATFYIRFRRIPLLVRLPLLHCGNV